MNDELEPAQDQSDEEDTILDQHETVDVTLAILIDLVDKYGLEIGITLTVSGTVISGRLISGREFFDSIESLLATSSRPRLETETPSIGESIGRTLGRLRDLYPELGKAPDDYIAHPWYIHLKNARHFVGDNQLPLPGTVWRGKLSAVDGFHIGELNRNS